jgi:succinate dehydrogenase hydrophobic anchor subunit
MLRVTRRTIQPIRNRIDQQYRSKSSSPLDGDAGNLATHMHHKMTTFLSIATPIYVFSPDSLTNGMVDKTIGMALAVNIAAHSWIGLNYVITDYVPKVSKAMVGPARAVTAGIGAVTLVGLGKVAFNDKGGLKGAALGLWTKKEEK